MAFDSLSDKLQNVFKTLRGKGRLTEDDVKIALREVNKDIALVLHVRIIVDAYAYAHTVLRLFTGERYRGR